MIDITEVFLSKASTVNFKNCIVMSKNPTLWSQPILDMSYSGAGLTLDCQESKKKEWQSPSHVFLLFSSTSGKKNVRLPNPETNTLFFPITIGGKISPQKQVLCQSNFGLAWMDRAWS